MVKCIVCCVLGSIHVSSHLPIQRPHDAYSRLVRCSTHSWLLFLSCHDGSRAVALNLWEERIWITSTLHQPSVHFWAKPASKICSERAAGCFPTSDRRNRSRNKERRIREETRPGCDRHDGVRQRLQPDGHPRPHNQDQEETFRAAEGESVPGERPDAQRVHVGRQSLGMALNALFNFLHLPFYELTVSCERARIRDQMC